ncbi:hypothetical protein K4F52_008589 [Lecanicillium sp. MT-2017a]|nr:hypothetical protein K4F52_008589 [Lecanicillium sp. MT-2017a]
MHSDTDKDRPSYDPLLGEDKDSDDDGSDSASHHVLRHYRARARRDASRLRLSMVLNAVLVTILAISGTLWLRSRSVINRSRRQCSSYSPILDLVDLETEVKKVNGTLFPPKEASIARQLPNPAADAIWEEWELTRVFPLTRAQIIKMGKDPSYVAKLENNIWGLGDDAYAGTFDIFHQLHCLNSLRQIAYGGYYNRSMVNANLTTPTIHEVHVNHCVDMLMQALQCSGNVNIMTMDWVDTRKYPYPDMSVNRECINFEKLTNWRRANTVDMDKYIEVMTMPDGVARLPMADQYYEYYGLDNPNHKGGANKGQDFNN